MTAALTGGVFDTGDAKTDDDAAQLRQLVDEIGRRSFDARLGQRGLPERFDNALWRNLEDTGLSRLTSTPDHGAGPAELAIVLYGLARHAAAVPLAETDLLAAWLGATSGIDLPDTGPLTVAVGDSGMARDVPWLRDSGAVLLAVRAGNELRVALAETDDLRITDGHNLAGEPRSSVAVDMPAESFVPLGSAVGEELDRRGAWARCVQAVGALDAAAEASVAHTRERAQFGRSLSKFQAVQHSLAAMAGEIERARAAATLAVAAAADYGFGSGQADYAVTVAKVVLGRVVPAVATIAHQLHGAIGVTIEHPLWLFTTRAQSWMDEFGSTGHHARRLGRVALAATRNGIDPWDVLIGRNWAGQASNT
jgi:acyl-CoA dehydrogenase